MRRPFWSIAIRPRLKISIKDRLQDVFKRTLNHPVANSRYSHHPDLGPPILRTLLLPSTGVTTLDCYCSALRPPLAVHRFPGVTGYTAFCSVVFLHGTRRASPVA